ncbi:hypothetical protein [Gluconobacter sp. OJB]|uniref:hypothetical protein n=1 Tax=Gluconobacter sp. OJB TaxID=3145196 RepID=UPI0031F8F3D6
MSIFGGSIANGLISAAPSLEQELRSALAWWLVPWGLRRSLGGEKGQCEVGRACPAGRLCGKGAPGCSEGLCKHRVFPYHPALSMAEIGA